jgi:hypothetical protein
MGSHPINLAVRFALELAALYAMCGWGWQLVDGAGRWALAAVVPLAAATLWGVFAVPADPSRSGRAPVPVPGLVRLAFELAFFGFATWAFSQLGDPRVTIGFATMVVLHYAASYDRVAWLVRTR